MNPEITRRRFLARSALTAGGVATVLSGCNAGTSGSSSNGGSGGTVTLTVMYNNNELTKEHIAGFEKDNPGIRVEFIQTDATRLNAMLASGNPPDLVRAAAVGSANTNARGLAADLTPYLEKSQVLRTDDLLAVNDSFRWDGSKIGQGPCYGIVKDWSQDATLWYNTKLFDKAKVPHLSDTEPISHDELLAVGKKLTTRRGGKAQVYGLGLEWAWNLWAPIMTMIMQQGEQVFSDDLTKVDLNTAAARRAIAWYVDFGRAGVGPTSLDPLPDGADLTTFLAQRMAITQDGYWYGGNFVKEAAHAGQHPDGARAGDGGHAGQPDVRGSGRLHPGQGQAQGRGLEADGVLHGRSAGRGARQERLGPARAEVAAAEASAGAAVPEAGLRRRAGRADARRAAAGLAVRHERHVRQHRRQAPAAGDQEPGECGGSLQGDHRRDQPEAQARQRADRLMAARSWSRYSNRTFYLFVSPWVAGFLLLTAVPLGYAFGMSLTNFDGSSPRWRWVGLRNYAELLRDGDAWAAMLRTIGFTAIVVPLSVAGALGLAVLLNRRLKAVGLWRTIFFLPSVVPVVAMAIMWKLVFNRDAGLLNAVLRSWRASSRSPGWSTRWRSTPSSSCRCGGWGVAWSSRSPRCKGCPPSWKRPRWWTAPVGGGCSGTSPCR